MSLFEQIAEEKIRTAMQAGEFDHLPGQGKPLILSDNPHEPEDWRMANHLLRANDVLYPWMELGKSIEEEVVHARQSLLTLLKTSPDHAACKTVPNSFLDLIQAINHSILEYNLRVPSPAFQKKLYDANTEYVKIAAEFSLNTLMEQDKNV